MSYFVQNIPELGEFRAKGKDYVITVSKRKTTPHKKETLDALYLPFLSKDGAQSSTAVIIIYNENNVQLTLARFNSSFWPAAMFSFLPAQARSTEACRARP